MITGQFVTLMECWGNNDNAKNQGMLQQIAMDKNVTKCLHKQITFFKCFKEFGRHCSYQGEKADAKVNMLPKKCLLNVSVMFFSVWWYCKKDLHQTIKQANFKLTSWSRDSKSLILFPLKLRCVNLGHFNKLSTPLEILLSLSSSWNGKEFKFQFTSLKIFCACLRLLGKMCQQLSWYFVHASCTHVPANMK